MLDWFAKKSASPLAKGFATEYPMVATGASGFLAGTAMATPFGWRPVEVLKAGDEVLTFDHGMQPIRSVRCEKQTFGRCAAPHDMAPLFIPRDAIGNRNPLWLKSDQGVLVEHDLLEDSLGDPFAVVPACTLEGYRGIRRAEPRATLDLFTVEFGEDEVAYIEAGVLGYCPVPRGVGEVIVTDVAAPLYTVLSATEARELVIDMITEDSFWTPAIVSDAGGHGEPHYTSHH